MNRPLGVIGRLGLCAALAGAAICVVVLACAARVEAAVDVSDFRATGEEDRVVLQWETAQEMDNVGFNLYRAEVPQFNEPEKLNEGLIPSKAFGEMFGASYSYPDTEVVEGVTYYYWLESVDTNSVGEFYSYEPESATPGPSPTPTSTSTPTSMPTATPSFTATGAPNSTPTDTPSFTATGAPNSTPTDTPTATEALPPSSSPSPVPDVEQRLSPTATPGGMAQPTLTPGPVYGERTPTPTPWACLRGADAHAYPHHCCRGLRDAHCDLCSVGRRL